MSVYSLETIKGKEHVQTVYTRKDNPIEVILKKDDQEYDYSAAKEIRVKIGSVEFDSNSDPNAFDRVESAIGRLKIFIGEQAGIARRHTMSRLRLWMIRIAPFTLARCACALTTPACNSRIYPGL